MACGPRARPAPVDPAALWSQWLGDPTRSGYRSARVPQQAPDVVWEATAGPGLRSTPVLTDQTVLVPSTDRELHALNLHDGTEYWSRGVGGPPGAPLVVGARIFLGTETTGEGEVRAVRFRDGHTEWRQDIGPIHSPIAFANDTVYGVTSRGLVFALRARDGHTAWRTRLPGRGGVWGPVLDGDRLYFISGGDTLYALDRNGGERLGQVSLPGRAVGLPALAGDTLVIATASGAFLGYSVRAPVPVRLWETAGFEPFSGGPVLAAGEAFAVTRRGTVVAVRLRDGRHRVLADLNEPVGAAPTVVEGGLLVGTLGGRLYLVSLDGRLLWMKQLEGSITHAPAATEGAIFVPMYGPVGGFLGTRPLRGKVVMLR